MIDKVKIGVYDYAVKETEGPITVDRHECTGSIVYEKLEINILTNRAEQKKMQTLMHEITHGIIHSYRIPLSDDDLEEITDRFATGFMQVIRDNPALIEYLRQDLQGG